MVNETEWRTLMQAARSLGISLSRVERYAESLSAEDYYALELPDGTRIRQVRLPALQALYQIQRCRHGERRDGQERAEPKQERRKPEETAAADQTALYQELLAERELRLAERELHLAECDQRIQDQAAQIARLESLLSSPPTPTVIPSAHHSYQRAKSMRRSEISVPSAPQETSASEEQEAEPVELRPLAALPETSLWDASRLDSGRIATPNIKIIPPEALEEQMPEDILPQENLLQENLLQEDAVEETKPPRKEIGKNGIAAAQWNGLTLVEDDSFLAESTESEEENAAEEAEAATPKKKKQSWLLSLLDES